ncbi:hypothetical protein BJV78DRAFT_561329 [Lactifluus subvellereus]|nr:hypothetical protein BJV78DRAFT_561329 [Lactifluus subvellereus]
MLRAALSSPYPLETASSSPLTFNLGVVKNTPSTADQIRTILDHRITLSRRYPLTLPLRLYRIDRILRKVWYVSPRRVPSHSNDRLLWTGRVVALQLQTLEVSSIYWNI